MVAIYREIKENRTKVQRDFVKLESVLDIITASFNTTTESVIFLLKWQIYFYLHIIVLSLWSHVRQKQECSLCNSLKKQVSL